MLLAADGYPARSPTLGRDLGPGQGSLDDVVMLNTLFWAGWRVLLTGHTGFKGRWLALPARDDIPLGGPTPGAPLAPRSKSDF